VRFLLFLPFRFSSSLAFFFFGCRSALNVFFNFRQPAPLIIPIVLLLIAHPLGKFLSYSLPITVYRLPRILGGAQFSLNPGPWNIKEHVLVFIMTNVSAGPAYGLNAIVVADFFYKLDLGFWFSVVLILTTQLTGFGLAGLCRRFLVWPASMVWPQNLLTCTLLNTLHAEEDENAGISRFRYFMYVFTGAFFFFFLPGYLFQALSVFSWICWIAPNNIPLNQVFGVANGLGMSILTFDWTVISWIGSPFMTPWWAQVHIFAGFVIFYWILTPILYYTNVSIYLPIILVSSRSVRRGPLHTSRCSAPSPMTASVDRTRSPACSRRTTGLI
jgi:OPT family oligopeptide transporter